MRIHSTLAAAVILAVAAAVPDASAQSTDVPTVAVMDINGFLMGEAGNSVNLGKAVSAMLVTEFTGRDGLRVIERQHLKDVLQEQRLALSGGVDESSAVEIGKLVGAQYMFYGQVASLVGTLRMDLRVVDVETTEIVSVIKKMATTEELLELIVEVADEFAEQLDLTPPSGRPEVEPIPVRATIEFSRGVDFEDRGETDKAIEHYEATLELYPNHRGAQQALERLRGGGE